MKRALIGLTVTLALIFVTAGAAQDSQEPSRPAASEAKKQPAEQRAASAGNNDFKSGAGDLKRGYGQGGRELGRGTAEFGKGFARADWDDAGRSLGRGAGEFGKNVGVGTGRGFKAFGLGLFKGGKSVAGVFSGNSRDKKED